MFQASFEVNKFIKKVGESFTSEFDISDFSDFSYFTDEIEGIDSITKISRFFSFLVGNEYSIFTNDINNINSYENVKRIKVKWLVIENYNDKNIKICSLTLNFHKHKIKDDAYYSPYNQALNDVLDLENFSKSMVNFERQTNYLLNKNISGIVVKYFQILPESDATDVVMNEHTIKSVKKVCDIKITVPDMEIPSDDVDYDEWGINFAQFEIDIEPQLFQEVFGKNARPRIDDMIYLPKPNILYRIANVNNTKGIDEALAFYKCSLKKADDDSNIIKDEFTEEFFQQHVVSAQDAFKEERRDEQIRATDTRQAFKPTIARDQNRDTISTDMRIIVEKFTNNGTTIFDNYYNASNIGVDEAAVVYKNVVTSGFAVGMWLRKKEIEINAKTFHILTQNRIDIDTIKITTNFDGGLVHNQFIKIGSEYFNIHKSSDTNILLKSRTDIIDTEFTFVHQSVSVMFQNSNTSFTIVDDRPIFRFNSRYVVFDSIQINGWTGLLINYSTNHKYIGVYAYKVKNNSKKIPTLEQIYSLERIFDNPVQIQDIPILTGGESEISAIRFYKSIISEENHQYVLGSKFLKKSEIATIIDDCEPVLNMPKLEEGHVNFTKID